MTQDTNDRGASGPSAGTISISKERFDAVPRRRFRYILLYLAIVGTSVGLMMAVFDPKEQSAPAADAGSEIGPNREEEATAKPDEESNAAVADPTEPGVSSELSLSISDTRLVISLYAIRLVLVLAFLVDFVFVFRTMGYPVLIIAAASIFVGLFPLPSVLLVAFLDRRVSKAWRNANDAIGEGRR